MALPFATPSPCRPRGAQPGNHNARTHGLYSSRRPLPGASSAHLALFELLDKPFPPPSAPFNEQVAPHFLLIDRAVNAWRRNTSPRAGNLFNVVIQSSARAVTRLNKKRLAQLAPLFRLQYLAGNARFLLDSEFRRHPVPAVPVFVPLRFDNLYANSVRLLPSPAGPLKSPWLTDAQWRLISGLVSSLREDLAAARKYRRHLPPLFSDRFLLNGILWKLATSLRWQDLDSLAVRSGSLRCARACQQLYHHLRTSGCMRAIYDQLFLHLSLETGLEELVDQGCFGFTGGRIILAPAQQLTWQKFTALLVLQRLQHNDRCLCRRAVLARPRRKVYPCTPRRRFFPSDPLRSLHPGLLVYPHCWPLNFPPVLPGEVAQDFIPIEQALGMDRLLRMVRSRDGSLT